MTKELIKEAFNYGYNSYHECNTDLDYQQHLKDCYVSILDSEYENNNGWIKIESADERFPYEDLWICNFNGNKQAFYHNAYDFIPEKYTHYQPIVKPKPPIY